jgi:hypothetical protein
MSIVKEVIMDLRVAKKPNQMIQAGQSLTPLQAKALFGMLAEFKFSATHDRSEERLNALSKKEYQIPLASLLPDYKKKKGGELYSRARDQIEKMMALSLRIDEKGVLRNYNVVSYSEMQKGCSFITAKFNRDIIPVLVEMVDNGYTEVQMANILPLKSSYSIRIYEILLKNRKMKHVIKDGYKISIEELRYLLGIDKKQYKVFADFKKRVLEPSYLEINSDKTNIRFSYDLLRTGRKFTDIRFFDIQLVKPIVESTDSENSDVVQTSLFDDSPLSILQQKSAREIREQHTPEYINFYYKKALEIEKKGGVKTSLPGFFFTLLSKDEDNFYDREKVESQKEELKRESLKKAALKKKKIELDALEESRVENEKLAIAIKKFEKLPNSRQRLEIKKSEKLFPFASEQLLKEKVAMDLFSTDK